MRTLIPRVSTVAAVAVGGALAVSLPASADEVTVSLTTSKDNTLIETWDGSLSLGAATSFYAGRVGPQAGGTIRRGVIAFDIASAVPSDALITDVTLTLFMSMTVAGPQPIELKRLYADWGEGASTHFGGAGGPSTAGDATWIHRFWPDVFWSTPGGDFTNTVSASAVVDFPAWYTWPGTRQLVADVQDWLDDPTSNFGWLVQGNESELQTVKQFSSRESSPDQQPKLTITYVIPDPGIPGDLNGDGAVNVFDLLLLLEAWGDCRNVNDCPADLDGNGTVNVFDLLLLLENWG